MGTNTITNVCFDVTTRIACSWKSVLVVGAVVGWSNRCALDYRTVSVELESSIGGGYVGMVLVASLGSRRCCCGEFGGRRCRVEFRSESDQYWWQWRCWLGVVRLFIKFYFLRWLICCAVDNECRWKIELRAGVVGRC